METEHEPMPGADRNDEGKYSDTYADADFVEAVHSIEGGGTTDVAEEVGCDRRTAYLRLQELEDKGELTSKKIGNALYWEVNK